VSLRLVQKQETRARILESAVELFESDLEEVKLKDVAERAGVAIPTVLFHFGSRFQLLMAVAEVLLAEIQARFPAAGTVSGTEEAVEKVLHLQATSASRAVWRVGDEISWMVPGATEPTAERFRDWVHGHLLHDGYSGRDADRLADLIAPGLMMIMRRIRVNNAPEELAERELAAVRDVLARWPAKRR
jgi:AcrR family transcriptional regulator